MDHLEARAVTPESFQRFGELLRYLRLRARLTQRELSLAVGYNFAQISRLECGQRLPDPAVIRAVFVPALGLSREARWAQRLLALAEDAGRQALDRGVAAEQPSAPALADLPAQTAAASAPGELALLATKLYLPQTRPSAVLRPRLLQRLDAALAAPLALVVAGPGFGKTTLLASWMATLATRRAAQGEGLSPSPPRAAWLSLDSADNDLPTLLRYLVAALQTLRPEVGRTTLALLQLAQPPGVPALLTPLLNDLAALPAASVLVLDDAHVLTAPATHDALRYLVERLPPMLHLLIAGRADPPLPLARLRARGGLVELRAADLRFTPDEAFALLHTALGVEVTPEQAGALEARTEGWAAGLQLAALALRGRPPTADVLATLTGGNRFIADYLASEVLEQLPAQLRAFVLQTAVLDRLCGPLCDAVLGIARSEGGQEKAPPERAHPQGSHQRSPFERESHSQMLLAELDRAQLFLVPLDDERRWYRYHHLFAEMVRSRLQGGATQGEVARLHRRAAAWFEQAGLIDEALAHARSAGDLAAAVALVGRQAGPMVAQGNLVPLRRWLEQLPAEAVHATPRLAIAGAMVAIASGDAARGAALLSAARAAEAPPLSAGDWLDHPREAADLVELTLARAEGAWGRAYDLALGAVAKPLADDRFLRAWARWELGVAALQCDRAGEARRLLGGLLVELPPQLRGLWLQTAAALGRTALLQGDTNEAAQVYALALEEADAGAGRGIGQIHLGQAALRYAQGQLAAAEAHARTAQALGAEPPNALLLIGGAAWRARIALARGDTAAAHEWMQQAEALHPQLLQPFLLALIVDELVQALLGVGAPDRAHALAARGTLASSALGRLAASRIALATGDVEGAALLAGALAEQRAAQGMDWIALEVLLVGARAALARGRSGEATAHVVDALRLALPGQLVQPFRDAGPAVGGLLDELGRTHPAGVLRAFIGRVRTG